MPSGLTARSGGRGGDTVNPTPGWYRDPNGATRWWDGERWTRHVVQPDTFEAERAVPQLPVPPEDDLLHGYRVLAESGRTRLEGHQEAMTLWGLAITFVAGGILLLDEEAGYERPLGWGPYVTGIGVVAAVFALAHSIRVWRRYRREHPGGRY